MKNSYLQKQIGLVKFNEVLKHKYIRTYEIKKNQINKIEQIFYNF